MLDLRTSQSGATGQSTDRTLRHDWTRAEAQALYDAPFNDLLFQAHVGAPAPFRAQQGPAQPAAVHQDRRLRRGLRLLQPVGAPRDGSQRRKLMEVQNVLAEARKAKDAGATRYCMGAAWRCPKARDMDVLCAMVEGVKALGMETCMTLGMLSDDDVGKLKGAGLDYYNHNIDTSERYYSEVITTRTFADRLETLARVREAGIKVCCGGIVGMGEEPEDRVDMLVTLANLPEHPESVPINMLIAIPGTPLADAEKIDGIDFVRTIALARILMPQSYVRLSAGRTEMSDEMQALCFFAGANSIFVGDTLLTADNPGEDSDAALFDKLGLRPLELETGSSEQYNVQES